MKDYWNGLTSGQKIKLVLTVVLGLFGLIFAVRNWQETEVILVFFKAKMPLTMIILLSAIVGFAFASVFDYRKFKKKDAEIKTLKSELTNLKKID